MDKIFEALASTPRRKMLAYVAEASLTAGEIAARFEMSKPAISKHLQILENAGAADEREARAVRPLLAGAREPREHAEWLRAECLPGIGTAQTRER